MADPIRCPSCGGTFRIDEERAVLYCPYCGAEMARKETALDKVIRHRQKMTKMKLDAEEKARKEEDPPWAIAATFGFLALLVIATIILVAIVK